MRNLSRFIPGEEIDAVAQWSFGAVDSAALRAVAKAQTEEDAAHAARDDVVRTQAFAEGFAQGRAHAAVEVEHRMAEYTRVQGQDAAQQLAALLAAAQAQIEQARQAMAQGVLELSVEMARQVLRHELSVNPNVLQPVVREGLAVLAADNQHATIRLNTVDLEVVREALGVAFEGLALKAVADASVKPGGCIIESAGTVVDATLQTRWRRVVAKLGLELDWDD